MVTSSHYTLGSIFCNVVCRVRREIKATQEDQGVLVRRVHQDLLVLKGPGERMVPMGAMEGMEIQEILVPLVYRLVCDEQTYRRHTFLLCSSVTHA